jgi:hypothetical protein
MLSVSLMVGGCSQTAQSDQADAERVEQAKALRAELEAGCAAQGYTPGTPEFQGCVGNASLQYTNAGFSKARTIHRGVKHGPEAISVYNSGMQIARTVVLISDARVKRNVVRVGRLENGIPLYRFTYLGGTQQFVGVLAQEVKNIVPAAVHTGADGLLRVDYQQLGFSMIIWEAWIGRRAVAELAVSGLEKEQP